MIGGLEWNLYKIWKITKTMVLIVGTVMYILGFFVFFMVSCQTLVEVFYAPSPADNIESVDSIQVCSGNSGSAVILMYRQFDEPNRYVSVATDQFTQHMDFFKEEGYEIVSLDQVVSAVQNKISFGKKWIAITIDGAHRSFYTKGKPILEEYKFPYTVFVNTESIGQSEEFMSWDELKSVAQSDLGAVGSHAHTQKYLLREMNSENRKIDILQSIEKIYQNTGVMPHYFSYPFGEISTKFINEIKDMKEVISGKDFSFKAAFSRTSGPVGCSSNVYNLPRFLINQVYGAVDDMFKMKVNSRHLPVYSFYPDNSAICAGSKTDKLYFSTSDELNLSNIRCYSDKFEPRTQFSKGLISVQLSRPIGSLGVQGRRIFSGRINCIAQTEEEGVFFWRGYSWSIFQSSEECFNQ